MDSTARVERQSRSTGARVVMIKAMRGEGSKDRKDKYDGRLFKAVLAYE
jgi:hypothetical protein